MKDQLDITEHELRLFSMLDEILQTPHWMFWRIHSLHWKAKRYAKEHCVNISGYTSL